MDILSNPSNLKCPKHKSNQIIFIKINQLQDNKNILYCQKCMTHDRTSLVTNFVDIQQIIDPSNNDQIINWPPVDDKILQDQIYNFQTQDNRSNSLVLQINQYFDDFKIEAISKIESCKKEMMRNISLFSQCEDQILQKLQEFQLDDQFKSILLNNKIEINEKENQCRDFINKILQQKYNYTQELKQMFENLNKKGQQIEFESAIEMKTKMLQMIENINFFKKENNQTKNIINKTNISHEDQQNIVPENKIDENKNIDLLPHLHLTKSNYIQQFSQNQQMKKFENNSIQIISSQGQGGSYYSELILNRNKKYVFRFQFKTTNIQREAFSIGLVRDSTKDQNYSFHDKLSCSFIYDKSYKGHKSGYGIDKRVKGDLRDTKEIDCVELRVSIEDGILEVVDYPHYNHKYVLSDQYKNNLSAYSNLRLAIYLVHEIEVTLINANVCEHFQN